MTTEQQKSLWEQAKHEDNWPLAVLNGCVGVLAFLAYKVSTTNSLLIDKGLSKTYPELNGIVAFVGGILLLVSIVAFVTVYIARAGGLDTREIKDITDGQIRKLKFQEFLKTVGISIAGFLLLMLLVAMTGAGN